MPKAKPEKAAPEQPAPEVVRVVMLASRTEGEFRYRIRENHELPAELANRLIADGAAERRE
ncbi:MAG: hypothetical protein AB7O81_34880 [Blastocatellales bacterium]